MRRSATFFAGIGAILVALGGAMFLSSKNAASADADAGGEAQEASGPPPAPVKLAKAEARMIAPLSDAPGSVVSTRDSLVAAETSGKLAWIAEVGAEVEEGDVIARIDPADAKLTRSNSAAEVRRLRARSEYLDRLLERYLSLGEDSGESEAALDQFRADRDEARQALAQAEVAFARADLNLKRTEVTAPFAGRIVTQEMQIGEFSTPGAAVVRLVDTQNLEVTARAPASLAFNLKEGDTTTISADGHTVEAAVRAVVPVGDALSRMLELRLVLPEPAWYIGSAVRVSLPTDAPRRTVAVHRDALILRSSGVSVFVIDPEDKARRVDVELGAAEGDFIEVIGDVAEGARVVVRGGERLRDGQAITTAQDPNALAA